MWLAYLLLFILLSPGILFTAPKVGIKMFMKGKQDLLTIALHGLLFVIVIQLLQVSEAFGNLTSTATTSGSIMNYDAPFRTRTCPSNSITNTRSRTVINARRALDESLNRQLVSEINARNEAGRAVNQYEQPFNDEVNREQEALQERITAKQDEINRTDPTVAPLFTALEQTDNIRNQAVRDASAARRAYNALPVRQRNTPRGTELAASVRTANANEAKANKDLRDAYTAYSAVNDPVLSQTEEYKNSQMFGQSADDRHRAHVRNRQDLYDARAAADTAYRNKRTALLRDPINADLQKAVALAIYNYRNACEGRTAIATSIPFTYQIFGVIF